MDNPFDVVILPEKTFCLVLICQQYLVELTIEGLQPARGQDYSIKGAEQNASEKVWQKINGESLEKT